MSEHEHLTRERIGYYLDASQRPDQPTKDAENACVICGEPWIDNNVRTYCVMTEGERVISLFYRVHRACDDLQTPDDSESLSEAVLAIGDIIAREHGRISGPAQGHA